MPLIGMQTSIISDTPWASRVVQVMKAVVLSAFLRSAYTTRAASRMRRENATIED